MPNFDLLAKIYNFIKHRLGVESAKKQGDLMSLIKSQAVYRLTKFNPVTDLRLKFSILLVDGDEYDLLVPLGDVSYTVASALGKPSGKLRYRQFKRPANPNQGNNDYAEIVIKLSQVKSYQVCNVKTPVNLDKISQECQYVDAVYIPSNPFA